MSKKRKPTLREFSKRVLRAMVIVWFGGIGFGTSVVMTEIYMVLSSGSPYTSTVVHLPELLSYIGLPLSCGLIGYLAKSAFENREKIKQNYIPDYHPVDTEDNP